MLNLNDLLVFVQVVDHGGFAAAGRALGIPKSTLSKRLSELEKAIGVRLVQRTSRSFAVTEVGRDFHRHAAAMLIEAEAAEQVIKGRLAEPSGTVRLTASLPLAQFRLAPLLPRLAASYPKVRIMLDVSDRFVDIVQEGFDIAIRNHFAPLPDTDLVQRRIDYDPAWLVASADYIREKGMPSRPEQANGLDGLMASSSDRVWTLHDGEGAVAEVAPSPRYVANETVSLLEAARAGLGVACLASSFCAPLIESGALVRILPDWTARGVATTLLMPHRRGQLPSVRVVADHLIAELSQRPPGADLINAR
ncbi:LysR substrate-binding domain-containing protein [Mesorhizobium sp.]|uniref:LysR substrate-binding domain-containing protein n=1 Tax=Mesorhizobium sp. TaxID=1871066 RepID=UPI000FE655EC|nr:LysR substrate-binding domain-containing protein [Mesorhizobium sp.]RWK41251.1 MAG: LysR family transcriptional regulator [Mesorhizobium sp.]RWK68078.1 MAG: LysR family transcriptional regulator [Mesorhizobium sp.]RWK78365.1 MAG: LysR family transcriptional regulator [Mesorhizobium sp.]RWK78934.1 MAG: LysR family transcriptional regulator [Mesorhizobium sp.]RWL04133.1 MAG: LysR family transcriptional regulator [Mesorhizobium sp.]